jgi:hypothetical protein
VDYRPRWDEVSSNTGFPTSSTLHRSKKKKKKKKKKKTNEPYFQPSDLGIGFPADRIFGELEKAWRAPLETGSKVLALTVPECHVRTASLNAKRDDLNKRILEYKAKNLLVFLDTLPSHGSPFCRPGYGD